MKLRKLVALTAIAASTLTLGSCGGSKEVEVKLGLGYTANIELNAVSYGKAKNQLDVTVAYVAFDKDGKVVKASLDVVQNKLSLAEDGGLASATFSSKKTLGSAYAMKGSSAIGAEVDTQINNFAKWTEGKTIAEIKAAMTDTKLTDGTTAGCTINVNEFVAAYESAYTLAVSTKLPKTFDLGLGMVSSAGKNYYGNNEVVTDFAGVVTVDSKVKFATADETIMELTITDGVYAQKDGSKYTGGAYNLKSKKVLGDAYAMKGSSALGKEWFEQVAAVEAAMVGKTATEVAAVTEVEGASITLTNILKALSTAAANSGKEFYGPQA